MTAGRYFPECGRFRNEVFRTSEGFLSAAPVANEKTVGIKRYMVPPMAYKNLIDQPCQHT